MHADMLRITKQINGRSTVLKLEGALREAWLAEVQHEAELVKSARHKLKLDLADVTFADAAGLALLGDLLRQGAKIVACSGFIAVSLGLEKP